MINICDSDRILKTEWTCNITQETAELRILMNWERDEADSYLWWAGLLNVKEQGMTIYYVMSRCLIMFLRGGKVNVGQYW